MRTREQFDNTLKHVVNNWVNGEVSTDDFIAYLYEYSENSPYAAIAIGSYLETIDPHQSEIFKTALWQRAND